MATIGEVLSSAITREGDRSKRDGGARLIDLLGRAAPDASDGFGDPLDPGIASRFPIDDFTPVGTDRDLIQRLSSTGAYAKGFGMMVPLVGYGEAGARSTWVAVGRIAEGRHDTIGTFHDPRGHRDAGWRDRGQGVPLGRPRLNIPIPANVPTLISVQVRVKVRAANAQTLMWGRIKIGSGEGVMPTPPTAIGAPSVPFEENVISPFSHAGEAGMSDGWEDIEIFHARRVTIAGSAQKPEGEIVPVRVYLYASNLEVTNRIRGGLMVARREPL